MGGGHIRDTNRSTLFVFRFPGFCFFGRLARSLWNICSNLKKFHNLICYLLVGTVLITDSTVLGLTNISNPVLTLQL